MPRNLDVERCPERAPYELRKRGQRVRVLEARRRRFRTLSATDEGRRSSADHGARNKTANGDGRLREHAETTDKSQQGCLGGTEGVTHFARPIRFTGVMHRAGLPRNDRAGARLFVMTA